MTSTDESGVSDSQSSQFSNFSLDLSQDTLNQVMSAVGMSAGDGDRLIEQFHTDVEDNEEAEPGAASISISRAIFNVQPTWPQFSQGQSLYTVANTHSHPPLSTAFLPHTPHIPVNGTSSSSTPVSSHTPSPSPHVTPQLQHFNFDSDLGSMTSVPSLSLSQSSGVIPFQPVLRSNIPPNLPHPGEYGFELLFEEEQQKVVKTANYTYSSKAQRLYLKQGAVIPFSFSLSKPLPPTAVIRALTIHKMPEMIAENLTCCPKHLDEQKRLGSLFPLHFVRSQNPECSYAQDPTTKRLSVVVPCRALQRKREGVVTALYLFPCFTSDLNRSGQLVQIVFTLENNYQVLGRSTIDIRVCASPGRDRGVDEKKLAGGGGGGGGGGRRGRGGEVSSSEDVSKRMTRKRAASANTAEVVQCTLPPKQLCLGLTGRKVQHTVTIYPELIPHLEVCLKMMEQIYNVRVEVGGGERGGERGESLQQDSEITLESWLDGLELRQYCPLLRKQGINSLFQVMAVTEEKLTKWGMISASHRRRFMEGKGRIQPVKEEEEEEEEEEQEDSPPLFPPSQSPSHLLRSLSQGSQQLSQQSSSSTQPFNQTFEVLQIQVKKTLSKTQR